VYADVKNVFQIYPNMFPANGCHLQGAVSTLAATQAMSVLWAYMDYDSSSVPSCRGLRLIGGLAGYKNNNLLAILKL
jgi:hypothetical protein